MSKLAAHVHSVRRALSLLWNLARHTNLSRTSMVLPGVVALAGVLLEIGRVHGLRLIAEALTSPATDLLVAGLIYAAMRVAVIARGYVQPVMEETLRIVLRGKLRTLVMGRSLSMPLRSVLDRSAGDLVQTLESDCDACSKVAGQLAPALIRDPFALLGMALYLAITVDILTTAAIVGIACLCVAAGLAGRWGIDRLSIRNRAFAGRLSTLARELVDGAAAVRAFGLESATMGTYRRRSRSLAASSAALERRKSWFNLVQSHAAQSLTEVAVLVLAGYGALRVGADAGGTVAALALGRLLWGPLQGSSSAVVNVAAALGPLERLDSFARGADDKAIVTERPDSRPGIALVRPNRGFALHGVTLPFGGGSACVQVDAEIPCRGLTLITGPNGAGKTTLLYVIFRFLPIRSGEMTLDGLAVHQWPIEPYRSQLTGAFGRPLLVEGTVADNVRFGNRDASSLGMEAACRATGLLEGERWLSEGLGTRIHPFGRGLSTGQRQRIDLARVLAQDRRFTFLDEPFEGLDPGATGRLADDLQARSRERSIVVVTHRDELLERADRVIQVVPT